MDALPPNLLGIINGSNLMPYEINETSLLEFRGL